MVDAFGPVGASGVFTDSLKSAMSVLRNNRDTLISVLEPFLKDPVIDWKKSKGNQRQFSHDTSVRDTVQAKISLKAIDERLRGIYNLRNPNLKRFVRSDKAAIDYDEEMSRIIPLSVEGQAHRMILEATSHENLVQLYIGWMPWI
jgi:serine/threonine-protein kinase ATR